MIDLSLLLWAVVPPILLVFLYHYRVPTAPSLLGLLRFFLFGFIAGSFADFGTGIIIQGDPIQPSFPGEFLRQLILVAPIQEGFKLAAVVIPLKFFSNQSRFCVGSIFLFTIVAALGFTAQENVVYLLANAAPTGERLILTPVQAILSAPWGYALGISMCLKIRSHRYTQSVTRAWLTAVAYHGLVNFFAISQGIFGYAFFPLLLWLFWQTEQLLRRVQGKYPIDVISRREEKR